jgi:hypothetical protein
MTANREWKDEVNRQMIMIAMIQEQASSRDNRLQAGGGRPVRKLTKATVQAVTTRRWGRGYPEMKEGATAIVTPTY